MKGHPSTFEAECRELKAHNRELTLQVLASDGQASDAYQEAKARRADNERLRRAMTAAIRFLRAGTPETAKMVLEQALRGQGK